MMTDMAVCAEAVQRGIKFNTFNKQDVINMAAGDLRLLILIKIQQSQI